MAARRMILDDALQVLTDQSQRNAYDQALKGARSSRKTGAANRSVAVTGGNSGAHAPTVMAPKDLDWSEWRQRLSFRPGELPVGAAWVVAFALDAVYVLLLSFLSGEENLDGWVFLPGFVLGIAGTPILALRKGRHWFMWTVLALGAGISIVLNLFGRPMTHLVFLVLLLARSGKPRCPSCKGHVERLVAECPHCLVDLSAQPIQP